MAVRGRAVHNNHIRTL